MIATASPIAFITLARRAANSAGVNAVVKSGVSAAIGAWVHANSDSAATATAVRIFMRAPFGGSSEYTRPMAEWLGHHVHWQAGSTQRGTRESRRHRRGMLTT